MLRQLLRPRMIVLVILWSLPTLLFLVVGAIALYQTGWLAWIAWILPLLWLAAWIVGWLWQPPKLYQSKQWKPLQAPDFWTPRDIAAISVVEEYRREVPDVTWLSIADPNRYLQDAQGLAMRLANHFHPGVDKNLFQRLTIVEILTVVHLAVEDLEKWTLENVPGSGLATVGHLEQLPKWARAFDIGQSIFFVATSIANPAKLLSYPLWRKAGRVTLELQDELGRTFYQRYLRQVGFYLIEMYSGRLQGGSLRYRQQFGHMAVAAHISQGSATPLDKLADVSTSIVVVGQVKAGKSSLINALMQDKVAVTSVLPQTREVRTFQYQLPGSESVLRLLDTPGYSEAGVSKQQIQEMKTAAESADIMLLVMAANVPARDSDLHMLRALEEHYRKHARLRPPPIIAVLTHIDQLRPLREWSPPYDWRNPTSPKEHSMAEAVAYVREIFGDAIAEVACVYTGDTKVGDTSVADELVPQLLAHLSHGHSAAILKAFYSQLSRERLRQIARQFTGLLKSVGQQLIDG